MSWLVVVIAVLALGIGVYSAIFSLVSAVWLKAPLFADAGRLLKAVIASKGSVARVATPRPMADDRTQWLPP
jgi:hypothetical protein